MNMLYGLSLLCLLAVSGVANGGRIKSIFHKRAPHTKVGGGKDIYFYDNYPNGHRNAVTGESLVLECWAGGSPAPTIHWLRNGKRLQQGQMADTVFDDEPAFELDTNTVEQRLRLGNTHSQLRLPCLSMKDVGLYECVAQSPYEKIVTGMNLRIVHDIAGAMNGNSICAEQRSSDPVPEIYMWSTERIDFEGTDLQLFCRATGTDTTITWWDNQEQQITQDDYNYKLLSNGDLLVRNIEFFANMGNYKCIASNSKGQKDEISAFLYPTQP